MARKKRFLETDVVTEAKIRIRHMYDLFDSVVVMFSGGKDSLVCVNLVQQVRTELGMTGPLDVIFRDEEIIPDTVIDTVRHYHGLPWVNLRWYAYPLKSEMIVMGKHRDYIQWDPSRPHVREMPPEAIQGTEVFSQHTMDEKLAEEFKGSVAFVTGVRADESLVRYRSVVNKLNENYINTPAGASNKRIKMVKPIYDWSEKDVFKWLHETGVGWCKHYDTQNIVNGENFRVATPLLPEAVKRFHLIREMDPGYYARIIGVFPDMAIQERYGREFDVKAIIEQYAGNSWGGVEQYISDHVRGERQLEFANARLHEARTMAIKNPATYTPRMVLKALVNGAIKRTLTPEKVR